MENTIITVLENGPYLVNGKFNMVDKDGKAEEKNGPVALCRCGMSASKPFCDGTHRSANPSGK